MAAETTAQNPADAPSALTKDELATGIILNEGDPFASKRTAAGRMKDLALPEDRWEVAQYGNGFAIMAKTDDGAAKEEKPDDAEAVLPGQKQEPYKWVRFHSKSNPMDPDDVVLAVNGEILQIRRNERVPVAQRFLEVADHARYRHYSQEPGKDRKIDREIHKYPYDVLGDATRADFQRWKRMGTKTNRENAERSGIPIEA